ncbi:hypothetical protein SteCoe_13497 [Stentor coeruleus]|uniref:Tr-type G domain-containing protein n=1 Tax=Stentor coeruleus TaxID=5963 RepID=A0A1R2C8D3_9CILI|nr:hypothetical protein SteCoe_13497 [Stentor coeruleus]
MARHRGIRQDLMDDYDENEDFDPMDDDESSADYYITQVIAKTGAMPRDKVIKALEAADWDINGAVKILKQRPQPQAKSATQIKQGPIPSSQGKQGGNFSQGKQGAKSNQSEKQGKNQTHQLKPEIQTKIVDIPTSKKNNPLPNIKPKIEPIKSPVSIQNTGEKQNIPNGYEEIKIQRKLNMDYPDVNNEILQATKPKINLVVIGHVDAGKSTLMGHLLYKMGYVDQKTIYKYEKESKAIGKDSFHFAWVLDAGTEERQRGVTIDVGCGHFTTNNREITLLDAPGHKDFIPNMISGAAQADAAVLVIDSSKGEFEKGFEGEGHQHGQTKEHSFLARALGITHIIVAINKLDTANWDQGRFEQIIRTLDPFLKRAGFKEVFFIPISGLKGINLIEKSPTVELEWYIGPTLIELIDCIPQPPRSIKKPFRLCIMDAYKLSHGSIIGQVVTGKIEGGTVKLGDRLAIVPANITCVVKNIEINGVFAEKAVVGESADLSFREVTGDFTLVVPGNVVCSMDYMIPQIRKFQAKVFTFEILFPITRGMKLVMFVQSLKVIVTVIKLLTQIDGTTGKIIKTNPRCFTKNTAGVIEAETDHKICLEKFTNYKSLGRVLFRDRSETVMAGMILELIE